MSGAGMALIEALVSLLIVTGAGFGLVGSYGLLKLPDLMTRLHAPTKATTLGVGGVLVASILYFLAIDGQTSWREAMVTLFLFLTAPISANMMAKAWLHREGAGAALPPTGRDCGWANDDAPRDATDLAAPRAD